MYITKLKIENLRCIQAAELPLRHPGLPGLEAGAMQNVTLLLGDNGAGKTTVLKAIALALLGPTVPESGLVPYRLRRTGGRGKPEPGSVLASVVVHAQDVIHNFSIVRNHEPITDADLRVRLEPRSESYDSVIPGPFAGPQGGWYESHSPVFFAAGYGATRRVESQGRDTESMLKSRLPRYQRMAGLFEDHVALRPLSAWLPKVKRNSARFKQLVGLLDRLVSPRLRFRGEFSNSDGQYLFEQRNRKVPFAALSDGYRANIGWLSDLLGHLHECSRSGLHPDQLRGVVLVDEIDLHLHPSWQLEVVPRIAHCLPRLQFVFTTHSPLVVGTLHAENIRLIQPTDNPEDNEAWQLTEQVHGLDADRLLLSGYFNLRSTRAPDVEQKLGELARKATTGDLDAAMEYMSALSDPGRPAAKKPARRPSRARAAAVRKPAAKRQPAGRKAASKPAARPRR